MTTDHSEFIDAKNCDGESPFFIATIRGHLETMVLLAEKGASLTSEYVL
jgi:ankyrin repeat protein